MSEVVADFLQGDEKKFCSSLSDPVIQLDSVGVFYKDRPFFSRQKHWALKDVTFSLNQGETLGVLGRNGAGKSTLLKILGGIINPDQGSCYRKPGATISLLALQLGFIQDLTGRENAILSSILLGLSRREAEEKLERILDFSELNEFIDRPVATYSAGMKARLGFGVAIEADPDVLLIDEVMGVGDRDFRVKSKNALLKKINSEKSIVIVSHDLNTISEFCDRAVVIDNGKSIYHGEVPRAIRIYSGSEV